MHCDFILVISYVLYHFIAEKRMCMHYPLVARVANINNGHIVIDTW